MKPHFHLYLGEGDGSTPELWATYTTRRAVDHDLAFQRETLFDMAADSNSLGSNLIVRGSIKAGRYELVSRTPGSAVIRGAFIEECIQPGCLSEEES
jgi:hypothetical protein